MPFRCIPLALWVFILACGPGEPSGALERSEVGDTVVIFSPAPVHPDTSHAREAMRWGQFSGDPDLLFSDIYAFSVTSDGSIIVHDDGEGIRKFDSQGKFLGRVAGTGAGQGRSGTWAPLPKIKKAESPLMTSVTAGSRFTGTKVSPPSLDLEECLDTEGTASSSLKTGHFG